MRNSEIHNRQSFRLKGYDYSKPGQYFITICTHDREYFFGEIKCLRMVLSEMGKIAVTCWKEIPSHFTHVRLGNFVVMPNHIHGILIILDDDNRGGDIFFDGRDVSGRDVVVNCRDVACNVPMVDDRDVAVNGRDVAVNGRDVAVNGRDVACNVPTITIITIIPTITVIQYDQYPMNMIWHDHKFTQPDM